MTSPIKFYPIGPISSGDPVVLASFINNLLYIGTFNTSTSDILFISYLDPVDLSSVNTALTTANVIQFTVGGNMSSFTLDAKMPISGIRLLTKSVSSPNVLDALSLQSPNNTLKLTSPYQSPSSPGVVFSTANYNIFTSSNQMTSIPYFNIVTNALNYAMVSMYFIPVNIYTQSNTGNSFICSSLTSNFFTSLQMFFCSFCSSLGINSCGGPVFCIQASSGGQLPASIGYTQVTDCQRGYAYNYCKNNQTCGNSNCYGACANTSQTCQVGANNIISCTNPSSPTTWYWIIIAVIIILIIVILLYYCYSYSYNSNNSEINDKEVNIVRHNTPIQYTTY